MFCDPKKRARFRTQKWGRNSRFTSPASKFVAPFLGPWSGRPPVRKMRAGRRQFTLIIVCFFALGCEDTGFTASWIAIPNWRQHMYQRILPCCLYRARCSSSCVRFATPKRVPEKWGRNSRFTSLAPFLGPWPGRPPVRKVRAGRRQLTLKIQCFFALGCEMLRRYWFHNVGTWCGRLFSYSYAVPFPGHRFRASCQAKAPRLGKFRDTTFSSKITLAPFPPVLLPHPPTVPVACPLVRLLLYGVRSVRAVAGRARRGRPQAWIASAASRQSDWVSAASAQWQGMPQ